MRVTVSVRLRVRFRVRVRVRVRGCEGVRRVIFCPPDRHPLCLWSCLFFFDRSLAFFFSCDRLMLVFDRLMLVFDRIVVQFLEEQGRMKFVRPLYNALHHSALPEFRKTASQTFEKVNSPI